jgi:Predicted redox protein, regulator of disulfide bond formation
MHTAHPSLDLRGIPCPLSFVKAKLFLEKLPSGTRAVLWLDNGEPAEQVPHSLTTAGHRILELQMGDNHCVLTLQTA